LMELHALRLSGIATNEFELYIDYTCR